MSQGHPRWVQQSTAVCRTVMCWPSGHVVTGAHQEHVLLHDAPSVRNGTRARALDPIGCSSVPGYPLFAVNGVNQETHADCPGQRFVKNRAVRPLTGHRTSVLKIQSSVANQCKISRSTTTQMSNRVALHGEMHHSKV